MSFLKNIKPPKIIENIWSFHPINQIKDHIQDFLINIGFEIIHGPEIETEEFNFDMLNIRKLILPDKCMILSMWNKNLMF